jgi:hypothetical protein
MNDVATGGDGLVVSFRATGTVGALSSLPSAPTAR